MANSELRTQKYIHAADNAALQSKAHSMSALVLVLCGQTQTRPVVSLPALAPLVLRSAQHAPSQKLSQHNQAYHALRQQHNNCLSRQQCTMQLRTKPLRRAQIHSPAASTADTQPLFQTPAAPEAAAQVLYFTYHLHQQSCAAAHTLVWKRGEVWAALHNLDVPHRSPVLAPLPTVGIDLLSAHFVHFFPQAPPGPPQLQLGGPSRAT